MSDRDHPQYTDAGHAARVRTAAREFAETVTEARNAGLRVQIEIDNNHSTEHEPVEFRFVILREL